MPSPATNNPTNQCIIRTAIPQDIPHLAAIERSAGELFRTVGLDSVADDEPMPAEVLRSYAEGGRLWVACCRSDGGRSGARERGEVEGLRQGQEVEGQREGQRNGEGEAEVCGEDVVGFLAAFPIAITGTTPSASTSSGRPQQNASEREDSHVSERLSGGTEEVLLHIAELSVHASHQRRGLATRLLRHFEEYAREQNRSSSSSSSPSTATTPPTATSTSTPARTRSADPPPSTLPPTSQPQDQSEEIDQKSQLQPRQKIKALSLTTYAHLPFNLPFYVRHGFSTIPSSTIESLLGVRARELWDEEQGKIAMPGLRVWGVKWLV